MSMPGASTSRSYDRCAPSASVTERACASTAVALVRASAMPPAATRSYVNCCAESSRSPAITALLNGHAVNVGLGSTRSEEHTSELQSQSNLVCRLLLEKKKKKLV